MTLVAAYQHRGVPIVIGDMAITRRGDATWRSLRKKAYIVSPNLAVAWSGSPIVARMVISSLRESLGQSHSHRNSFERVLTSYDEADFGNLHMNLVGWLVDTDERCFLWNCQYPKELFYSDKHYDGSGQQYFESLKSERWDQGGQSDLPPSDKLVLSAMTEIAKARFEESLYRETWDRSFGISYDVIIFQDGRFKYVPTIVYIGWDYFWDSAKGTGTLKQAPIIWKHNCFGDFSIVQQALHGDQFDGVTYNYLSRPVFDDMKDADLSNFGLSIQSDYYANYFLFRERGKTIFKCVLVLQQLTDEGPLQIGRQANGAYYLRYDTAQLDTIYRSHAKS